MGINKLVPLTKGIIKRLPGAKTLIARRHKPGTGTKSLYCYNIWMRHLVNWAKADVSFPKVVAEIGPGSSLGSSIAALLSGAEKVYALEAIKYWDVDLNLKMLDEIVELFKNKTALNGDEKYPLVRPKLEDYNYPAALLPADRLAKAMHPDRIEQIRKELKDPDNPNNKLIEIYVPWDDTVVTEKKSIDFIFSQGVLQSIEDIDNAYYSMQQWIKPGGIMSHTIALDSLGHTIEWNDFWTYTDFEWTIVKGGDDFLLNRCPASTHLEYFEESGFEILFRTRYKRKNRLKRSSLAPRYKQMTEEDLNTDGLYVLVRKR